MGHFNSRRQPMMTPTFTKHDPDQTPPSRIPAPGLTPTSNPHRYKLPPLSLRDPLRAQMTRERSTSDRRMTTKIPEDHHPITIPG